MGEAEVLPWRNASSLDVHGPIVNDLCQGVDRLAILVEELARHNVAGHGILLNVKWEIESPTFRATALRPTIHNGQRAYYRECQELIDGRWEGFVSMWTLKQGVETNREEVDE